jgi:hypothetical protein
MDKGFLKIRQRAQVLIDNPDFQKEILEIRKRSYIPISGIKTNEESQNWHNNLLDRDQAYFEANWNKVSKKAKKLEKENKFTEAREATKLFNKNLPLNAFYHSIKMMLSKFRLPLGWEESVRRYALFNDINKMWFTGNVVIKEEYDFDTGLKTLSIVIDDTTTLQDIKDSWSLIKEHQKRLQSYTKKKIQPIRKLDRDQRAYELEKEGKSLEEIADIINVEFNDSMDYNYLKIVLNRYKKRLNIS